MKGKAGRESREHDAIPQQQEKCFFISSSRPPLKQYGRLQAKTNQSKQMILSYHLHPQSQSQSQPYSLSNTEETRTDHPFSHPNYRPNHNSLQKQRT
ncbi:hypothetical protein VTL71DRAFT_8657 [Oculimacula yallundae]|uniref:Uncharacterized protein n=1 Tax=Oculimacula yallundae TaxID=86028 RepID=A0ABR4CYG1_9HELO